MNVNTAYERVQIFRMGLQNMKLRYEHYHIYCVCMCVHVCVCVCTYMCTYIYIQPIGD